MAPIPLVPPVDPVVELLALRALRDQVQAMYDRGGHITRAQVKAALDEQSAATATQT